MASTYKTPHRRLTPVTPRSCSYNQASVTSQISTDDPVTITPRRRTPLTPVNTQTRTHYRSSRRIPRQTLHNRKKRKLSVSDESLVGSESPGNENTIPDDTQHQNDNPPDLSLSGDSDTADLPLPSCSGETCSDQNQLDLYPGSTISVRTSNLLIRSFNYRHHLTYQAKADLLQLLQVHLPHPNQLPSTLYTFQKQNRQCSVDVDPEVTEHHYCSQCYTILTEETCSACTLCGVNLVYNATPYFIVVSIPDQLKVFLKRKYTMY